MHVDICRLPDVETKIESADAVIVVDALRASVTLTALLEAGATRVRPVTERSEIPDEETYITVGERNGKRLDGFDFDNSPRAIRQRADRIDGQAALRTTNGTQCVAAVDHAETVLMGSVVNMTPLVEFCCTAVTAPRLWLLPARRHGDFAPEDLYAVVQLREAFSDRGVSVEGPLDDRADALRTRDAETVFRESETGQYLSDLGKGEDVLFCSERDTYTAVPLLDGEAFVDASKQ
jgi:phosphosulfolactate phosphohydrolase-like enzyme